MSKFTILGLLMIALIPAAFAASLSGTIYDLSLEEMTGVRVSVNSTPQQFVIADGAYELNLQPGEYELVAVMNEPPLVSRENITITEDGDFVRDIILLPSFETEEFDELFDVSEIAQGDQAAETNFLWFQIVLVILIVVAVIVRSKTKKSKSDSKTPPESKRTTDQDLDENLTKIIQILKQAGGRSTQKDISKELAYSEAKVSLMITELEAKEYIAKIKKGRGNIILLRKKD